MSAACVKAFVVISLFASCAPRVVCTEGLSVCDGACVDTQVESAHCGACGQSCNAGQMCQEGTCVCPKDTEGCEGSCVDVRSDAQHCGACGKACADNLLCEDGECVAACRTKSACGRSCVSWDDNAAHCGACNQACGLAQSCRRAQCTFDVTVACFSNGQIVGVQEKSHHRSAPFSVGAAPMSLSSVGDSLWVLDGVDNRLYRRIWRGPADKLGQESGPPTKTGAVPNHVLPVKELAFLANAGSGTLQALSTREPIETQGELSLGPNSFPEGVAEWRGRLFVPLYGGYGSQGASAGQKVMEIRADTPSSMTIEHVYDLTTLDLRSFPGKKTLPRPYAIVTHREQVYVALNNLDADSYVPEGPGMLAKISPATRSLEAVELPKDMCLNPIWLLSDGELLWISCQGRVQYSQDGKFEAQAVEGGGVVVLNNKDQILAHWALSCPEKGQACVTALASRMALLGSRLYVGDQNQGRLFVLEWSSQDSSLKEVAGFRVGKPLSVCPVNSTTRVSNVADVWSMP